MTNHHRLSASFPITLPGSATVAQPWQNFRRNTESFCDLNSSPFCADQIDMTGWRWPKKPIIFISDPHADKDAFVASLVASGGIKLTTKGALKLTKFGKQAIFVIGGDCLDKGPSNLSLLDALKRLYATGANVKLLAGNHDLRLITGLLAMSRQTDVGAEHLFIRMGHKVIPLFREVFDRDLRKQDWRQGVPDPTRCRELLYPSPEWPSQFREYANGKLTSDAIEQEIRKLKKKVNQYERHCLKAGMSLQMVYAAARRCVDLFIEPKGEYGWFFRSMQLAYKKESFLFVHAGLDDSTAERLKTHGVSEINQEFHRLLEKNLFEFYFSPLSSVFRTKYRKTDAHFSRSGAQDALSSGVKAVVHGHVNSIDGQQLSLQQGLLHVECDITLDRNSRKKEGLEGIGFGATIIHPDKQVIGISVDHPCVKVLSDAPAPLSPLGNAPTQEYRHAS